MTTITAAQFIALFGALDRITIAEILTGDAYADFDAAIAPAALRQMPKVGERDMLAFFDQVLLSR
jgi:hypothetical protein